MGQYLRNYVPGGTYFFTVVTHQRAAILTSDLARKCLRAAFGSVQDRWPFEIIALVLMPDHLHAVWSLPDGDSDFSLRWQKIKELFTRSYLAGGGKERATSHSRMRKQERGIWHPRFWEHTCRDEADLKRCVDYLHWNPVKHGLVSRVCDYPYSTFDKFVRLGEYPADWGGENPCLGFELPE